jgi:hypothetical protein
MGVLSRCVHPGASVERSGVCAAACCRVLCMQGVLDPSGGQLSLTLDLHDAAADVPSRVASFLQVSRAAT